MKKFEIDTIYSMRSSCDHNCIWTYFVTGRTAQTVTLSDGKKTTKCRINKAAALRPFSPWAGTPWPRA